jgi:hypothetical protein
MEENRKEVGGKNGQRGKKVEKKEDKKVESEEWKKNRKEGIQ